METYNQLEEEQPAKRPVFLKVLGILTFINLGFAGLSVILAFLTGPASADEIENYMALNAGQIETIRAQQMDGLAGAMEKTMQFIQYTNAAHYLVNTLNLFVVVLGIVGVIQMFKGKRLGFHLYIISCIIKIGSFYSCAPLAEVPGFLVGYYLFTSLLFIFLYSRNLKYLK